MPTQRNHTTIQSRRPSLPIVVANGDQQPRPNAADASGHDRDDMEADSDRTAIIREDQPSNQSAADGVSDGVLHGGNDSSAAQDDIEEHSSSTAVVQSASDGVFDAMDSDTASEHNGDGFGLVANDDATENISVVDDRGQSSSEPTKTSFAGHTVKKGRLSYFDRDQMDRYVQQFQPPLVIPRRRHSMNNTNPPLSRSNRFSLDTIPESILASSVSEQIWFFHLHISKYVLQIIRDNTIG